MKRDQDLTPRPRPSLAPRPLPETLVAIDPDRRKLFAGALATLAGSSWMAACGGGTNQAPPTTPPAVNPPANPPANPPVAEPPVPPRPAPTGNIVQYLTSDGGSAADSGNLSSPTRDFWHRRMGFRWARIYGSGPLVGLGNWLDAAQAAEGDNPHGSTGAATAVGQVVSATVTTLVQRWLSNGANRGFYLSSRASASAWAIDFFGRTAANTSDRPKLTVVTTTGTFTLVAAANATWNKSSFRGIGSAAGFRLTANSQPAVLRFDLQSITGTLTSAVLSLKVSAFDSGRTGQIVDVFECDPPFIIVPENVPAPTLGLANNYSNFNALKASGHPALLVADDFELGGPFDGGFTPAAARTFNAATGTTYARGEISSGSLASADSRLEVSQGTGARGAPNVIHEELFGQYHLYLESNFGTTADTAIKIPAMGVQFGYWVSHGGSAGYWQQTTGNGGSPGTGLKVDPGNGNNFRYEGHSVRFLTGVSSTALDDDPYFGWFGIGIYDYNLDQVGPFPTGASFPMIALRKEHWYCIDMRVKQNSVAGAQDALGNFATANPDGVFQVWINGYLAYSRTTYRWRRHREFGVQGVWMDVYHGGTVPAPTTMHYRLDRVALATSFIGPKVP